MDTIPADIAQSLAITGVECHAGQPSMLSNMAYANIVSNINLTHQNAVSQQQNLNELNLPVLSKAVNAVANIDPMEARSANLVINGK